MGGFYQPLLILSAGHPRDPWSRAGGPSPPIQFGQSASQPALSMQIASGDSPCADQPTLNVPSWARATELATSQTSSPCISKFHEHPAAGADDPPPQPFRADAGLSPLASQAGRRICHGHDPTDSYMQQLQLAMDLTHDSLRSISQKYANFPMWYLASCTDRFVANRARKALSEFEKLLDVASSPEQHLIMELRTVPYGTAPVHVVDTCHKFQHMMRMHAWVEDCRTRCLQAMQAISASICGLDPAAPWTAVFDFSCPQMLLAGMQWSETIHTGMWQQAAVTPRFSARLPGSSL